MPELEEITAFLAADLAAVERTLDESAESIAPLLTEAGRHTFRGGKRLRPALVLLAARLCGYAGPRAIPIAAGAELLHVASLIHDDVVDGAATRRGQPSVNARFGQRLAVLCGDFLMAQSSLLVLEEGSLDIIALFSDAIRQMSEGEVLQLARSFDPDMPESVYMDVIGRKTAVLIAASAEAGAILGGVTRAERRALREYGFELGIAFQLVDDALDYTGEGAELGKAPFADLAEGKLTLPLLSTLKRCSVGEREAAASALKSFAARAAREASPPGPDELLPIAALVARYAGAEATLERARAAVQAARSRIVAFVDGPAKTALVELCEFVVRRRT